MIEDRNPPRLRVIVACYHLTFRPVRDAIRSNFRGEYRCSCHWCPLGCSLRDIAADFRDGPGIGPADIDVMLAVDDVNGGNPQNNMPWHTAWLDKAPAGVWRLFIDAASTVDVDMVRRLHGMTCGRDVLACMKGADNIDDVTRDLFVRLLSYARHF